MYRKKALLYTLAVVVAGLGIFFLTVYVEMATQTLGLDGKPYLDLSSRTTEQMTISTTKLDQYLSDGGAPLEQEIIAPVAKIKSAIDIAFEGGQNELGRFDNTDEEIRLALRSASLELETWINSARTIGQLKQLGTEGVSPEVQKMQAAKGKILAAAQQIMLRITDSVKSEMQFLKVLFWLSTGLWVAFVAFLAVFVYRVQHRSERVAIESKEQLDKEEKRMQQLTGFIEAVSNGNFDIALESSGSEDHVIDTLVRMKTKLKDNADIEAKRTWATTGEAQIGEILRNSGNSSELFDSIIKFIVKYTRSNQGGLFVLNDEDSANTFLELAACYAFERKKFLTKKVNLGDGIIGQSFLEKAKTHLTEIPEDYVNITSGLGGTTPKSILVVPLKTNDSVYGVLELASFNEYAEHEVDLIEKFAESIASTVSSVKVNERTRLLLEQTQQQAEEMKSQEEEMRQNMEELSATQEQLQRQMMEAEDSKKILTQRDNVFELTTILSESDKFGTITFVNDKFTRVSKFTRDELMGQGHNIVRHPDMPGELFRLMWETIRSGGTFQGIIKNKAKDGSPYWVDATIVPIRNEEGDIYKYIGARYHITNNAMAETLFAQQMKRLGLEASVTAS